MIDEHATPPSDAPPSDDDVRELLEKWAAPGSAKMWAILARALLDARAQLDETRGDLVEHKCGVISDETLIKRLRARHPDYWDEP